MLFAQAAKLLQPLTGMEQEEIMRLLEHPPQPELGDVAFPCFTLAKTWRKAPHLIAAELADKVGAPTEENSWVQAQAAGGYVNFTFDRKHWLPLLLQHISQMQLPQSGAGKRVVVEFSSPNIAKPFGVGHLRSTVIGHSLARLYEALGYTAIRINHLGDWGTQFGKEIAAYKRWGDEEKIKANPIPELLALYVRFHEEAEKQPELEEEGRLWFKKLEEGDPEARQLWSWFVEESLKAFRQTYALLGVEFDHYTGESFYSDKIDPVVEELREKNLLQESDGAYVVDLSDQDMPPCIVLKQDGTTIYATRDLAAAIYRHNTFRFDKMLYVVGAEQTLHFRQVFAVLEKMGYSWSRDCEHIPFGLLQLDGKKMSTRKGRVIFLEEVLQEAVERAKAIVAEKNPGLPNQDEVARQIGVGAVIFHDLKTHRIHNVNFSWEEVLSFEGESGPYVQYTYARTQSLLRRAQEMAGQDGAGDDSWMQEDKIWRVLLRLMSFPEAVERAVQKNEPSQVARYLLDLCQEFNRFYHDVRILVENRAEREAKLALAREVGQVLKQGLYLLGLEAPPQI